MCVPYLRFVLFFHILIFLIWLFTVKFILFDILCHTYTYTHVHIVLHLCVGVYIIFNYYNLC